MSNSSLAGALGLGRQASKDTPATSPLFVPATSIGLNMNQNVQALPAEVGGDFFLRGSYKASVSGGGDVGLVIRPNTFGHFLYMLTGQDSVSGVVGQAGAYQHVYTPYLPGAGISLPWYTCLKDVTRLFGEQYLNTRMRSLRIDVPKSSIATTQASLIATTPSTVSISGSQINGFTETFDTSPAFQTCVATVTLAPETLTPAQPALTLPTKIERFSFDFANNISEDEFSVGNYYLDDITLLQRTVQVSMDFIVRDTSFYQAVYLYGGAVPSAWSPQIYRGALTVTLNSLTNIGSTTQPYSLALNFPGLDFMMAPINMSGAELLRASLQTQVTLGPTGGDRFSATLINGIASY